MESVKHAGKYIMYIIYIYICIYISIYLYIYICMYIPTEFFTSLSCVILHLKATEAAADVIH